MMKYLRVSLGIVFVFEKVDLISYPYKRVSTVLIHISPVLEAFFSAEAKKPRFFFIVV